MVRSYTFDEKNDFSKKGTLIITKYLESLKETISVENVEEDTAKQLDDIDLIWRVHAGNSEKVIPVEVKTDSYKTGNFWLETYSNYELQTLGCFLKTKAQYVYYYFIKWDRLYIIPMKQAIPWFMENLHRFWESKTTTKNERGVYTHTTVGRLVKIDIMMKEVKEIKVVDDVSKLG